MMFFSNNNWKNSIKMNGWLTEPMKIEIEEKDIEINCWFMVKMWVCCKWNVVNIYPECYISSGSDQFMELVKN